VSERAADHVRDRIQFGDIDAAGADRGFAAEAGF
jgi:hypothetical protein